jgi:hypothetical protein
MTETTLALMMTDLEDSTGGWDRYRLLMQELLVAYLDLVEKRLQPVPRVESFTGDGHLLSFPTVDDSARAGLWLRETWNARRKSIGGVRTENTHRLKAGIHRDRVTRLDDGRLIGGSINVCARVLGEARPGEILVSESAFRNFDDRTRFRWGETRSVRLRGLHSGEKRAPGTPLYPLLAPAGEAPGVPTPGDALLSTRKVLDDLWTEVTSLWGTLEENSDREVAPLGNILTLGPDSMVAHYTLGIILSKRGDDAGAEREFREARRLEDHDAQITNALASSLKHQ